MKQQEYKVTGDIAQINRRRVGTMDREKEKQAFAEYAASYDNGMVEVRLKIDHTYRVAEIAERIARSIGADGDFAWYLGLLHDIGRFEQVTKYKTFRDADSVDHAEFGADLLFGPDDLIRKFPVPEVKVDHGTLRPEETLKIAETAIRMHNKLTVPEELDAVTKMYCHILRDADKVDIFRVIMEPPYDERNRRTCLEAAPAGEEIMVGVYEHRCLPRTIVKNRFEGDLGQCCMAFELVYKESIVIAKEQGYVEQLINLPAENEQVREQMACLRSELHKVWGGQGMIQ